MAGWSVFDFVIVSVSVIMLAIPSGSAGNSLVKQMRLLRAFRLLRILSKMGNLKKIVTAITMSIVPTLQSLVISRIKQPIARRYEKPECWHEVALVESLSLNITSDFRIR